MRHSKWHSVLGWHIIEQANQWHFFLLSAFGFCFDGIFSFIWENEALAQHQHSSLRPLFFFFSHFSISLFLFSCSGFVFHRPVRLDRFSTKVYDSMQIENSIQSTWNRHQRYHADSAIHLLFHWKWIFFFVNSVCVFERARTALDFFFFVFFFISNIHSSSPHRMAFIHFGLNSRYAIWSQFAWIKLPTASLIHPLYIGACVQLTQAEQTNGFNTISLIQSIV